MLNPKPFPFIGEFRAEGKKNLYTSPCLPVCTYHPHCVNGFRGTFSSNRDSELYFQNSRNHRVTLKSPFFLAESYNCGMKCLFLIFPFAYLYTHVKIFMPAEYGMYLWHWVALRVFLSRFVYLLGFCCPDPNDSEYMLWTKIHAPVTCSDLIYILCQHSRNVNIAANSFGSFLQPTKNLARNKFMLFFG